MSDHLSPVLPSIRYDVDFFSAGSGSDRVIAFHDSQHFVPKSFFLAKEAENWLSLFNGRTKWTEIVQALGEENAADTRHLLSDFFKLLNQHHILDTPDFRLFKEQSEAAFERADIRPMTCNGSSYPDDSVAARVFLDAVFSAQKDESEAPVKAIFAPHIDYRVGLDAYIPAFKAIQAARPERIVLLATSHYSGMYHPLYENIPVIATVKHFETPFGRVETDQEAVSSLLAFAPESVSKQDRAHRIEHSIELHAVLLKYLLPYPFKIVPLLVGSIDELLYTSAAEIGNRLENVATWLNNQFADDDKTLFCVSGDLAHIGRKFGDRKTAASLLPDVRQFDAELMKTAISGDSEAVINLMRSNNDAFRICGFPPMYLLLKSLQNLTGEVGAYQIWDETERASAVTFSSMIFRKKLR